MHPISLSDHTGGKNIREIASWVCLDWNFNAGCVITSTIRRKADSDLSEYIDGKNYVMNQVFTMHGGSNYTTAKLNSRLNQISDGRIDGKLDIF